MNILLSSIKYVGAHSDHVSINHEAIDRFVADFMPTQLDHWIKACPFEYRPCPKIEDEIDRWFLADAMAYCFWGYPTKWTIKYEGKEIDGWWALLASIQRAIEKNTPILDGNYLANLDVVQAGDLFSGEPQIPLLAQRISDFNQIGTSLVKNYSGRFHNYLAGSPMDATEFIADLATKFPTFQDVSYYKGQPVYFYKKAQLLANDLSTGFDHSKYVNLSGLDYLTGEADYKIPALLRKFGVLQYAKDLAVKVDSRTELAPDSAEEIEVRAGMLWACHLIVQKLKPKYPDINALTLDGILWILSQDKSLLDKPYHLTLTTDY